VKFAYEQLINTVRGDSMGQGDMPMEYLQAHTHLPVGTDSHIKFTLQSKNELYLNFESAIYREPGDPLRFTYPIDHPLAAEFEEQMTTFVRE
jgi:hypothetical protein